ncbi:MAG: hypothetical protein QM752_04840 [Gammaproteobacteria bacterium]
MSKTPIEQSAKTTTHTEPKKTDTSQVNNHWFYQLYSPKTDKLSSRFLTAALSYLPLYSFYYWEGLKDLQDISQNLKSESAQTKRSSTRNERAASARAWGEAIGLMGFGATCTFLALGWQQPHLLDAADKLGISTVVNQFGGFGYPESAIVCGVMLTLLGMAWGLATGKSAELIERFFDQFHTNAWSFPVTATLIGGSYGNSWASWVRPPKPDEIKKTDTRESTNLLFKKSTQTDPFIRDFEALVKYHNGGQGHAAKTALAPSDRKPRQALPSNFEGSMNTTDMMHCMSESESPLSDDDLENCISISSTR